MGHPDSELVPGRRRIVLVFTLKRGEGLRSKKLSKLSANQGVALIEVLISITILGVMTTALAGVMVAASGYINTGGKETVAVHIARERYNELQDMSFDGMDEASYTGENGIIEDYGQISGYSDYKRITRVKVEEKALADSGEKVEMARLQIRTSWGGEENPDHERSIEHEFLRIID